MKINFFFLIVLCIILNCCKNKYNNVLNEETEDNTIKNDTFYLYHKSGLVKAKGLLLHNNVEKGWWSYYNKKGELVNSKEFLIINDSSYLNQEIHYKSNNEIDLENSSFLILKIPDTIFLGKNAAFLKYYSHLKNPYKKSLSVVIENTYDNGETKKDIFGDDSYGNEPKFGVYAKEEGDMKISGYTIETVFYKENIGRDSASAKMIEHKKYFSKNVFVKNNNGEN